MEAAEDRNSRNAGENARRYLAVDIGASSGRHVVGSVSGGRIVLEEAWRFDNSQVRKGGHDCWDIDALAESVKSGIDAVLSRMEIESIGIDTWGVDFVLLDADGNRCCDAVAYRDSRTSGADAEIERDVISFPELYARTGIQKAPYNTIYQLWALKKEHPEQLERASHFLTIPEYLTYRLTGRVVHEYTCSSTTSLLDAAKRDWDFDLIDRLGLPRRIFGRLEMPGALSGRYRGVKVLLPAMHDTASAYLAVPARDDRAVYLSSGTWSLIGVERDRPDTGAEARTANFTNEGGAWGRYRFLKNIMGLWMIQSIRRELNGTAYVEGRDPGASAAAVARLTGRSGGASYSFADLEREARASAYDATVDANDPRFLNPATMTGEVMDAVSETGMPPPRTPGDLARCVYRSLAKSYADAVRELSNVTGREYTSLNIVGGGSRDAFLNELTARSTGLEVFAGPVEGTSIGNLIVQMAAGGEFGSLDDARRMLRRERGGNATARRRPSCKAEEKILEAISGGGRIAALTGAGVSTLSGIPDFRGPQGLYKNPDAERIFDIDWFDRDPRVYYRGCRELVYGLGGFLPGPVHLALRRMEDAGRLEGIITQNIDMLHQKAGSSRVYEVHGSPAVHRCRLCGGRKTFAEIMAMIEAAGGIACLGETYVPRCECGGVYKPDITFFGEALPSEAFRAAQELAAGADLMLVLGTSLTVYPAAALPRLTLENGGKVVVVNAQPTPLDELAFARIPDLAAFSELV